MHSPASFLQGLPWLLCGRYCEDLPVPRRAPEIQASKKALAPSWEGIWHLSGLRRRGQKKQPPRSHSAQDCLRMPTKGVCSTAVCQEAFGAPAEENLKVFSITVLGILVAPIIVGEVIPWQLKDKEGVTEGAGALQQLQTTRLILGMSRPGTVQGICCLTQGAILNCTGMTLGRWACAVSSAPYTCWRSLRGGFLGSAPAV